MAAALGDFVIGSCDVPVFVGWSSALETVAGKVESVSLAKVVWLGEGIEVLLHNGIDADIEGIHRLNLSWGQRGNRTEAGIGDAYVRIARGAERVIAVAHITDGTRPQAVGWHDAHHASFLTLSRGFIVHEKEETILQDRSTQGAAEDVANQLGWDVGLAVLQLGKLHKVVVGAGEGIPVIFVKRTMKVVGAALGYQRHLSA